MVIYMNELNKISIIDIADVIYVHSEKGRKYTAKNRSCYGISFCQSGKIMYKQNGFEYLSTKDSVVILPQGASYSLTGTETGNFPVINFTVANLNLSKKIDVLRIGNTSNYIKKIEKLRNITLSGNRLASIHLLYEILIDLYSENENMSKHIKNAVQYINQNYSDCTLSNIKLSEYLGISEIYLRKLFETHLATTPKQYIINIRIQNAKRLIAETNYKISDIAEMCGFTNAYHFSRTFKLCCGYTPLKYRNSYL